MAKKPINFRLAVRLWAESRNDMAMADTLKMLHGMDCEFTDPVKELAAAVGAFESEDGYMDFEVDFELVMDLAKDGDMPIPETIETLCVCGARITDAVCDLGLALDSFLVRSYAMDHKKDTYKVVI